MDRVAVFVDAGYLFAQGSVVLAGSKQRRTAIILNTSAAVSELTEFARTAASGAPLLRIYWYDGVLGRRPTIEHDALAGTPNIKMRLGAVNSAGEQKGVDSMIVIDMIDLARNRAISDALLLSGDEDVRVGVQVAQSFGVRVHLLGITPSRGSQSRDLLGEADTTHEWGHNVVSRIMSVRVIAPPAIASATAPAGAGQNDEATICRTSGEYAAEIGMPEAQALLDRWRQTKNVPPEYHGRLMARNRAVLGRDLGSVDKKTMRHAFIDALTRKLSATPAVDPGPI